MKFFGMGEEQKPREFKYLTHLAGEQKAPVKSKPSKPAKAATKKKVAKKPSKKARK
jgi:hypothetical protein